MTNRLVFFLFIVLVGCTMRRKPLSFERIDYNGVEFRLDGYYYYNRITDDETFYNAYFFYRNGVFYQWGWSEVMNLQEFETKLVDRTFMQPMDNVPYGWGVFKVLDNKIHFSRWSTSVGGPYPSFDGDWVIVNDTTVYDGEFDNTWHFKEFATKPDSTNRFIDQPMR